MCVHESGITGDEICTSSALLNWQLLFKVTSFKGTIPFTIASKRIKYLGRNLPRKVLYPWSENYQMLMKETEENFLTVQQLRLHNSSARGIGSVSGWGTKILPAIWWAKNKNKNKLKMTQTDGKMHCFGVQRVNIVEMTILYKGSTISMQITNGIFHRTRIQNF